MELRHLRYFVAIAESGGFTRAAARLHVAQPAVSRQLRYLESELGVTLFDRARGRAQLTHAGRSLLSEATALLESAERFRARSRRAGLGQVGQLSLGLGESHAWRGPIPSAVRRFRASHPDVDLEVRVLSSHDQLSAITERRLDAGFLFHRPSALESLNAITILRDQFVLAVPAGSPFARRPPLRMADLADADFIWFPRRENPGHYDHVMDACRKASFAPRIVLEASTATAMLALVAAGVGVTFVLSEVRYRKPASVVLAPVPGIRIPATLELVWRRDNDSPILRQFVLESSAGLRGRLTVDRERP